MSFLLGLTGSIGMGKSTTAQLFADRGCKVWDADRTVHRAYGENGAAVASIAKIAPSAVSQGFVDRAKLRALISQDAKLLPKLEAIIHPLVKKDREAFIASNPGSILVFDIPLLFELNSAADFDAVACVLSSPKVQESRVLARSGMTAEHFQMILSKQWPAEEKAARADYIIDTNSPETAARAVDVILA
ncbi:dephospho-CoA kinase, partial [Planktomarina temperata]|nr:dephospho-CoA kinase [Planktomarina temperata]